MLGGFVKLKRQLFHPHLLVKQGDFMAVKKGELALGLIGVQTSAMPSKKTCRYSVDDITLRDSSKIKWATSSG